MKTISRDKKVFAILMSIVAIAMMYSFAGMYRYGRFNGDTITESVSSIYSHQNKTITAAVQHNAAVKSFVPLIPFISQHWNLSYGKAKQIVDYAFLYGKKYRIDPLFILSEIATESSFKNTAYSNLSAVGIMQVYPKAHWNYVLKHHYTGKRYYQLFHLRENIRFGAYILATDLHAFGSMNAAAAHYFGICSFDKTYVKRIDNNYKLLYRHYYT